MSEWLKTKGKLVYDPTRQDFKKTHKSRTLILELPRDQLDLYYRWFLKKQFGSWFELQRPMWGLHVTVVRGDEFIPKDKLNLWKRNAGEVVEISYSVSQVERHWAFWSLTVESPRLVEIRKELGLTPIHRFHITIGRQYDWQPKLTLE